jgi:hypothetical protein
MSILPDGPLPTTSNPTLSSEGQVCGGFAGVECLPGLMCDIPEEMDMVVVDDAQGICKKDTTVAK